MSFKNKHLSYSRLSRFEQCPLSFKLHYVEEKKAEPGIALRFGKGIHAVLERLLLEHKNNGGVGVVDEQRAVELWQQVWAEEGLSGVDVFQEGVDILKSFVRDQGVIDGQDVLAIEEEFRLPVGTFSVLGYIDRVDRVDEETVEIIDYKTNRQLFTRDEVDANLQMSLYHLAAQQLWPWVRKVRLTFHMLRHGIRMSTERTREQLDAALAYIDTMGEMTESATEFPARLNANCIYCDHRDQCPAYAEALKGHREIICKSLEDLDAVATEREEVSRLAKILYARKQELEGILKAQLKDNDELVVGGVRYKMFNTAKTEYPLAKTVDILTETTGQPRETIIEHIATIDGKALEKWLKAEGKSLGKSKLNLLKAELEASATKRYSPRFWAKAVSL